jgi:hypothetical protein
VAPDEPFRYPRLAPELRRLRGDALRLWGDAQERRAALEHILHAWETGSPELPAAMERVDAAVVAGLAAVGLPRGPVQAVLIEESGGWAGQKLPSCVLRFGGHAFGLILRVDDRPDAIFKTWVHESLHGRQPYSPGARAEYSLRRGYEEGLVEGLARLLTRDGAGMDIPETSYNYYVVGYQTLAAVADVDLEQLWRVLWQQPAGRVRTVFARTVADLRRERRGQALTPNQAARLRSVGDQVFQTQRQNAVPSEPALNAVWRTVFR